MKLKFFLLLLLFGAGEQLTLFDKRFELMNEGQNVKVIKEWGAKPSWADEAVCVDMELMLIVGHGSWRWLRRFGQQFPTSNLLDDPPSQYPNYTHHMQCWKSNMSKLPSSSSLLPLSLYIISHIPPLFLSSLSLFDNTDNKLWETV